MKTAKLHETGVIHGRFQVFHNDHLKYLLAGRDRCRHLVVGITNPDPTLTKEDPADPGRTDPTANPLTYYERYMVVQAVLRDAGVDSGSLSIVPLPINLPDLYTHYVPLNAVFFLTIYDAWGRKKLDQFQAMGLKTEVLWEKPPEQKGIRGSHVRALMARGGPWEQLVPPATARLMKQWDIPRRLQEMALTKP